MAVWPRRSMNEKAAQHFARRPHVGDGERHLGTARITDRRTHFEREALGNELGARFELVLEAIEQCGTLFR